MSSPALGPVDFPWGSLLFLPKGRGNYSSALASWPSSTTQQRGLGQGRRPAVNGPAVWWAAPPDQSQQEAGQTRPHPPTQPSARLPSGQRGAALRDLQDHAGQCPLGDATEPCCHCFSVSAESQDHVTVNEDCSASLEPRLPARDKTSGQKECKGHSRLTGAQDRKGGRQGEPPFDPETKPAGAPRPWGRATEDLEARAVPRAPGGGRPLHRRQGAHCHRQGAWPAQCPRRPPAPAAVRVRPAGAGAGPVLRPRGHPGLAPRPRPAPPACSPRLLALPPPALTGARPSPPALRPPEGRPARGSPEWL
ncbi:PREDICTED: nutritionally-regulated adipose and cardiac enriched protein homolog isoform X1 [Hipposideros armiger]|uniref:Nutritionally-regulated adipose and cardiac enriched protein homolog isoform X1 n=1 Tax=Hipposideros armiger TaxID=186990 RepID=A0A8B7R2A9_HIPAR|nr:PREDICTED: nutritionally-regulated adipose and cardiac enriched protein homolog isoform X1 [Hipposideros armiger]